MWPYNHRGQDHITNWKKYISTATMFLDIKLGKVGVCNEEHLLINSYTHLYAVWIRCLNNVHYISIFTDSLLIKHGNGVTYCKGFPLVKALIPISKWLLEVTWQAKNLKSQILQKWSLNLSESWHSTWSYHP